METPSPLLPALLLPGPAFIYEGHVYSECEQPNHQEQYAKHSMPPFSICLLMYVVDQTRAQTAPWSRLNDFRAKGKSADVLLEVFRVGLWSHRTAIIGGDYGAKKKVAGRPLSLLRISCNV
jgi:hypothetical protein